MQFSKITKQFFSVRSFCSNNKLHDIAKLNHVLIPSRIKDPKIIDLVVLHGLLGSLNNFQSIMKNNRISSLANSYLLDLRNHGDSQHKSTMTLEEVADDVYNFIIENNIQSNLVLLAHSFGARVAMTLSLKYPELLKGLIIIDMVPYNYYSDQKFGFTQITYKMLGKLVDINFNQDYDEIVKEVEAASPNVDTIPLIMRNIGSDGQGEYRWKANIKTIYENYIDMQKTVPKPGSKGKYKGPVKVLCGEKSDYTSKDILPNFKNIFENFNISTDVVTIKDAGHWLHYQKPYEFITEISTFLQKI